MADFKARMSDYVTEVERHGPMIVTKHGRPAVVVSPVPEDPEDLERLLLAHDPAFQRLVKKSLRTRRVPIDEARRIIAAGLRKRP